MKRWQLFPFYVTRLPSLSLDDIWDTDISPDFFNHYWAIPLVKEALLLASPSFYKHLEECFQKQNLPLKTQQSFWKYIQRMASRCTPFGLFAGYTVGLWGEYSGFNFENQQATRVAQLDGESLAQLTRALLAEPKIYENLLFFPNNTLYAIDSHLRYTESKIEEGNQSFFVSEVSLSDELQTVLQKAKNGATIQELVGLLINEEIAAEDALGFIELLIEQQLLVSEIEPTVTGMPHLWRLYQKISTLEGNDSPLVKTLKALIHDLEFAPNEFVRREQIMAHLASIEPSLAQGNLLHINLRFGNNALPLKETFVKPLIHQIQELEALNTATLPKALEDFCKRFRERYEDREIAFLQALDDDFGIGYGQNSAFSGWLEDLDFSSNLQSNSSWDDTDAHKLRLWSQCIKQNKAEIELQANDLAKLSTSSPSPLPSNFFVFGSLLSPSIKALEAGDFSFCLNGVEGPSAVNLLGRFCNGDAYLTKLVRGCIQQEENQHPHVIFAEVVHSPEGRLSNVITRPQLRAYEIPYVGQSSVDDDHTISLDDLLISVTSNHRIIIRSKRLQKEIIPRLSTAHNYRNGLGVYRFLCDLQGQYGRLRIYWQWGELEPLPFLPRVRYKQIILSRATWHLSVEYFKTPLTFAQIEEWFRQYPLFPDKVSISEGDNELLLDLSKPFCQEILITTLQARKKISLSEWLQSPDQCWVQGPHQKRYTNEMIIPGWNPTTEVIPPLPPFSHSVSTKQVFFPGEEWLSLKLYAGESTIEHFLIHALPTLICSLKSQDCIHEWFFVRFADPHPHLRLRFRHHSNDSAVLSLLNLALRTYLHAGTIYKVQIDTYQREIERYHLFPIKISEEIFTADSEAILAYLSHTPDDNQKGYFALSNVSYWLDDFGLDLNQKVEILALLQSRFLSEHAPNLKTQLNDKYRREFSLVEEALLNTNQSEASILLQRSEKVRALIESYLPVSKQAFEVIASYIHLSLNRLFANAPRTHELIIYHFLLRFYSSESARQRKSKHLE